MGMNSRLIYILYLLTAPLLAAVGGASTPSLDVRAQKYTVGPDEYFPVEYRVFWEGPPGACTVLPPSLPTLDWGEAALLEVKTKRTGDVNETSMVVGFRTSEAGTYETPALDIRVLELTEDNTQALAALPPDLAARVLSGAPVTVKVKTSGAYLLTVVLVLSALLGVGLVLVLRQRRRSRRNPGKAKPSFEEESRALLHEARRHRLDGDFYTFYRTLRRACDLAAHASGQPDDRLCALLDQRIKDTGYRGQRPSEDDLEGDFKDVEHCLAQSVRRP